MEPRVQPRRRHPDGRHNVGDMSSQVGRPVPPGDRRRFLLGTAALVGGALAGCSKGSSRAGPSGPDTSSSRNGGTSGSTVGEGSAGPQSNAAYVPPSSGTWERADPAATGWDPQRIDELVAYVGDQRSSTFMVLAGGRVLAEDYWGGATEDSVQDIASCQKSVVSTLVGIVVDEGRLGLEDAVNDHLGPGWSRAQPDEEAAITIRHLLTMTSGLSDTTLRREAEPGTVWRYNTPAYQKLRRVLEAATGEDIDQLSRRRLFDPIGIGPGAAWAPRRVTPFNTDPNGDALWGLQLTARDMGRVGLLAERDGVWGDTRVVPDGWFAEAWTPLEQNPDYGYLWWLYSRRATAARNVPRDLVAALGALDQKIYVVPSTELVVTRQGLGADNPDGTSSPFDRELLRRLVAARTS